jgi:tetratricopeptide (TPR) repeat protein
MAALKTGDAARAAANFEEALRADRIRGCLRPRGRFLSYYGLACALAGPPKRAAIQACELALARDSFDPRLHLNLGRVYLLARRRSRALAVLERGIRLHPGDAMISALLARVDRRKQPVIGSLGRDHPLNRAMGRARYTFRRPSDPDWDLRSSFRAGRGLG